MNIEDIIKSTYHNIKNADNKGATASYIPELACVDAKKLGVHISGVSGYQFGYGDYLESFSIQSISKVLSLTLAYKIVGEAIWKRLGVEPSGNAFNSLIQLETDKGIPRNPFINAGAIVIADILLTHLENPKEDFLAFIRSISNNLHIEYNAKIAVSEKSVGYRNIAVCNFMKSFGNIKNEPNEVLDFYFDLCSLQMNTQCLTNLFLIFANEGRKLNSTEQVISKSQCKRMNALMQTCGFYDESGEFAFKVGLAGKSGVGGGIIAIHPKEYAIAVWSPKLNAKGNSYKGVKFLEEFTTRTELSIF